MFAGTLMSVFPREKRVCKKEIRKFAGSSVVSMFAKDKTVCRKEIRMFARKK